MRFELPVTNKYLKSNVKRDPSLPKGRQLDNIAEQEVLSILGNLTIRRDLLIEALHLIQDSFGFLTFRHLKALSEVFKLSQAEVYEVASFYHHFDIVPEESIKPPPITIRVCEGLSCEMAGARNLISTLNESIDSSKIRIQAVPCIGRCAKAPVAQIGKRAIDSASKEIILKKAKGPTSPIIPKYQNLQDYLNKGGYACLKSILVGQINFDSAIKILSDSGLRGLGGAGFPVGKKWEIVHSYSGSKLMTINGDD